MDIEKARGISVTSSVLQFTYGDCCVNILDTPGHQDFSEDTYRTLMAADAAVMVIDGAKGVEAQTRKLMEVCRMRSTPVIVFINKLDRPSKEPFDLLDEVEKELHIRVRPLAFPISNGPTFKGVYNLYEKNLSLFTSDEKLTADASTVEISDLASPELDQRIGAKYADQLRQDVELVEGVYDDFDARPTCAANWPPTRCRPCSTTPPKRAPTRSSSPTWPALCSPRRTPPGCPPRPTPPCATGSSPRSTTLPTPPNKRPTHLRFDLPNDLRR
mgnify:CR=1 FL=1